MFDLPNKVIRVVVLTLLLAIVSESFGLCAVHSVSARQSHRHGKPAAKPAAKPAPVKHFTNKKDIEAEMDALDKRREEIHRNITNARKKEKLAYAKLHEITHKLQVTQGTLKHNKRKLDSTVVEIHHTQTNISQTQTAAEKHEQLAGSRLREIYEGHRLSFLEMLFQVDSLQNLLDRMYFQERIAALDRNLLEGLRAKREALEANKNRLDQQKNALGDLVSEISKKAMDIVKMRTTQEQAAENLRKQRALFEQAERELALQSKQLEKQILAMETSSEQRSSGPMQKGTGSMAMPLKAKITSPFGWRTHPIFKRRRFHTGVDLAGPHRSPIRASDSGHVLFTGWFGGYGKVVIVSHGNGLSTLYAHLSSIAVSKGANINKGDVVGYEGATGWATGPHLHFEVRVEGKPNNPLNFVN